MEDQGFITDTLAKLARFSVSKFAAFGYAVAVGVSGNLIYEFAIKREPVLIPPAAAIAPATVVAPVEARPVLAVVPPMPPAPVETKPAMPAAPAETKAAAPVAPAVAHPLPTRAMARPVPAALPPAETTQSPAVSVSVPTVPAPANLPAAAALPVPPLQPEAVATPVPREPLVGSAPTAAEPREAALPAEAPPLTEKPVAPPLGPAIEVAPPPHPPTNASDAPIPLFPSAVQKEASDAVADAPPPKPLKPGLGSGGLY